ncbi:hypothetical protein [uncultured Muribaculum sp.]|uniref:hypothetical protein n=1 Tax=uncultured Muribaculum sp. TaxID=1918613 RepID=UPI002592B78D|nr:hypothetical protein [uncultured Muribaculum sp.]
MKTKIFNSLLFAMMGMFAFTACDDDDVTVNTTPVVKEVVTSDAEFTACSATMKGLVSGLEKSVPSSYKVGALYSLNADPKVDGVEVIGTLTDGVISATTDQLEANNTYYYCSFVTLQGKVSYYGEVKSFVTVDAKVNAPAVDNVTAAKATVSATVSAIDGVPVEPAAGVKLALVADEVKNGFNVGGTIQNGAISVPVAGLLPSTTYYYAPYVKLGDGVVFGETKSFTTLAPAIEYVDLGLSVMWASANLGAEAPEEIGSYIGYGATSAIENSIDIEDYPLDSDIYGTVNDAAFLAGTGRMPVADEVRELMMLTTHEWTTVNGVQGMKFTADNGNSIFLPAAGSRYGETVSDADAVGNYWIGQADTLDFARTIQINPASVGLETSPRNVALSIRPVKKVPVEFHKEYLYNTWYIDLDETGSCFFYDGPHYYYGGANWNTVSNGELSASFWSWLAKWSDISAWIGFEAQRLGKMTLNADGTVHVEDAAANKVFDGTYTVNEADRTISFENAEALHTPGAYSNLTTNLNILSLTPDKFQLCVLREGDDAQMGMNYISEKLWLQYRGSSDPIEFDKDKVSCGIDGDNYRITIFNPWGCEGMDPTLVNFKKSVEVTFAIAGVPAGEFGAAIGYACNDWGVNSWGEQVSCKVNGDGTYTAVWNGATNDSGSMCLVVDILGMATALNGDASGVTCKLIEVKTDNSDHKLPFDNSKVSYAPEGANDYRITLVNPWGCEGMDPTLITFAKKVEVVFSIEGIPAGEFDASIGYACNDWGISSWGEQRTCKVSGDGVYTATWEGATNASGSMCLAVDIFDLVKANGGNADGIKAQVHIVRVE